MSLRLELYYKLFRSALSTHKDLTEDDIKYASLQMCGISSEDIIITSLVHLLKSNYVGMFSFQYNKNMDGFIKSKRLDNVQIVFWPESKDKRLSQQEKEELDLLEKISIIAMKNLINFASVITENNSLFGNFSMYEECLNNLCYENNIDPTIMDIIVIKELETEIGSLIKIKKSVYVNILDLIRDKELSPVVGKRYHKEIVMYGNSLDN